ncbi:DUF262 domain-containing protein [Haloarchaeobius sp. TZWSO28]|uniref:DUF262 domain-containing protein n=1 Tax=Haloarchaeobius sp. TZWSO28 TaxID=3446119 RepID=UPI003EB6CC29
MADSGTKNFGSILSAGLFRIPNYQRGYAWTSSEVNDLLDDLEYVTETETVNDHYLNSIIVTEAQEEVADVSHVIDGQQRLLTTNLLANEILRKAYEFNSSSDPNVEYLRDQVGEILYEDVFKSTMGEKQRRVLPADEHRDIFKRLVPTDVESSRDLESIKDDAKSPSEQKLVGAVETIEDRLDAFLKSETENSDQNRMVFLNRLASTLHSDFTATLHEVDNPSEAGRIFEAINDRGRSLNRADRIKSYLVYRATLGDISIPVEDIHEAFTEVYETLNTYASSPGRVDTLVDRLIGQHWNLFAGESQISNSNYLTGRHEKASEDIDQIKHANYHVPKTAGDERVEKWMKVYLESLQDAAEAYVHIRGMDVDPLFDSLCEKLADDVDSNLVRHQIYAIENFGYSTAHSLSMTLYMRFVDEEAYESITEAMETLAIRMFGVGGARRDTKRSRFESLSRALFWSSRDDLTDVFPEDSPIPSGVQDDVKKYNLDGSSGDGEEVINRAMTWAHNYSHEMDDGTEVDTFKRRLEKDNLDGLGVAGWGGLNANELKNYMLYRYEAEIRSGGADLPQYLEAGIYDFTVEHVWPQNRSGETAAGLSDDEYAHFVERIGNLAFLSLSENSSAGNQEYSKKWENAYEDAADGTKMVRDEFPDPTGERSNSASKEGFETWSTEVIEWRSEKMAKKLSEYWNCNT